MSEYYGMIHHIAYDINRHEQKMFVKRITLWSDLSYLSIYKSSFIIVD